jgi:7,8-dihydropterin-6-yl-methyl-4-(beta-D-ribofuranosyl)aminobenzene 5'-phosphate synthase
MRVRLLTENLASDLCWLAEWGFSAWIEYGEARILFDTGFSDVYRRNAETAGIDLEAVDLVAVSHFHSDHTRGLLFHPFRSRKRLAMHPRVMTALLDPWTPEEDAHAPHAYAEIEARIRQDFEIVDAEGPTEIAPGAFFLGRIPRVTSFEKGTFFEDPMEDDTALAFRTEQGAVVVTGCSHSGICNICEHAKSVTGQRLRGILGGFHLMHKEKPAVDETIAYLKAEAPEFLLPVHCVEFDIQARMQQVFGYDRPGAGSVLEF